MSRLDNPSATGRVFACPGAPLPGTLDHHTTVARPEFRV